MVTAQKKPSPARSGRRVENVRDAGWEKHCEEHIHGRGQPRTVPDYRVRLATAVDALVVDAGSLLDRGGGDDDAVLGREQVEAQHHRSQGGGCG